MMLFQQNLGLKLFGQSIKGMSPMKNSKFIPICIQFQTLNDGFDRQTKGEIHSISKKLNLGFKPSINPSLFVDIYNNK
jgi:hypothetical protein